VIAFENGLCHRAVLVLIYNRQATDAAAQRLVRIAEQSNVPTVGITETGPPETNYQNWIMSDLGAIAGVLSTGPR
jgi:zinc/manganese transport system substrate-binding protein